jgi:hypothetical protein
MNRWNLTILMSAVQGCCVKMNQKIRLAHVLRPYFQGFTDLEIWELNRNLQKHFRRFLRWDPIQWVLRTKKNPQRRQKAWTRRAEIHSGTGIREWHRLCSPFGGDREDQLKGEK